LKHDYVNRFGADRCQFVFPRIEEPLPGEVVLNPSECSLTSPCRSIILNLDSGASENGEYFACPQHNNIDTYRREDGNILFWDNTGFWVVKTAEGYEELRLRCPVTSKYKSGVIDRQFEFQFNDTEKVPTECDINLTAARTIFMASMQDRKICLLKRQLAVVFSCAILSEVLTSNYRGNIWKLQAGRPTFVTQPDRSRKRTTLVMVSNFLLMD
jgi:hypothetical protein